MNDSGIARDSSMELDRLKARVADLEGTLREYDAELTRSRAQVDLMKALVAATDPSNQEDVFHAIVYHLAAALHVSHAVIGSFHLDGEQQTVETIAVIAHGEFIRNFSYPIEGTPCAQLLRERMLACEHSVQQRFPEAPLMKTVGAEGYCGFTLYGRAGQPIGVLAALDVKPLSIPDDVHPSLMLYAARAAAELQRREADAARRESERRLRFTQFAVDHAEDGVLWADESQHVVYANEAACRSLGYSREELSSLGIADLMAGGDEAPSRETRWDIEPGTSVVYESRHRRKDGTEFPIEASLTGVKHEGTRYTCGIVRDITLRKRIEAERLQALYDLQNITETVPDLMFTLDCHGRLVKWNSRVVTVTGYAPEILQNKPALEFVPPDEQERTAAAIRQALTDGYAELDGHLMTNARRLIPYHWTGAALRNPQGEIIGITGIGRDVSEHKRAERQLVEQRQHLMTAQALAHLGSWEWDLVSGGMGWSDELYRIFGHEPGVIAVTYETFLAALHPNDHDRVLASVNDALRTAGQFSCEYRIVRSDGEVRVVHARGTVQCDETGRPRQMNGTVLDITERKVVEEALRAGEERWQLAVRGSNDGIWDWNFKTGELFFSTRWKAMRGFEDDEHPNTINAWRSRIHPDDLDRVLTRLDEYIAKLRPEYCEEYRVERKDGSYIWVLDRGVALWTDADDGTAVRMAGSVSDITERKRMEEQLRESEARHRAVLDTALDAVISTDDGGRIIGWNPQAEVMFGYRTHEAIGRSLADTVIPRRYRDDHADGVGPLLEAEPGPSAKRRFDFFGVDRSGREFPVEFAIAPTRIEGRPSFSVFLRDITDRKRAEDALRESELRYRLLVDMSPSGIFVYGEDKILYVNHAACRMLGAESPEQILEQAPLYFVHPDCHAAVLDSVRSLFDGGAPVRQAVRKYLKVDRTVIDVEVQAAPITWNGKPAIQAVFSDITERVRQEEELHRTTAILTALIQSSPVAVITSDVEGRVTTWNPAAQRMFGWTEAEVLGQQVPYIPEDKQEEAEAVWTLTLEAGITQGIELRRSRKDGSPIDIEFWGATLRDRNGRVTGSFGMMADITERKQAEEALRGSEARLKEAQRIAHIGSWELDLIGDTLTWSDETYRIFEVDPKQFGASYEAFLALVHPEDRDPVNRAYTESLANRTAYDIVHRLLMKDGRVKFVRERCETRYLPDGRPARSTGTIQDITEQKQAGEALARRERELRTVLDTLPVGVWFTDAMGKVLLANPAGRRIWEGVAKIGADHPSEHQGWWEQVDGLAEPHRWALVHVLTKGEPSLNETLEIECRDGSHKIIRNSAVPVRGLDERIIGAIVLNEDITDRIQAEQALRQHHALLSAIMDAAADIIYVKNREGRYLHMNKAGAGMVGRTVEEVVGQDDDALWPPDLAASCKAADRQVVEEGKTLTVEEAATIQGKTFVYLTYKTPYRDAEGRIIGIIGVSRDITERKAAERERERQYDELHAIFGMTVALSRASSLQEIYDEALNGVTRALKSDRASILLFEPDGLMRLQASRGLSETYRATVDRHSPWSRDAKNPEPLLVENTATDPLVEPHRSILLEEGINALAFIPLVSPDRLLGKFMLYFDRPHTFTANEIGVAQTIASQLAHVIQRARAEEALRTSEERFAKAFRASLHPIVIAEMDSGLIIDANDASFRLFGYDRAETTGRTSVDIGLWPSREDRARFVAQLAREGSVKNLAVTLKSKHGDLRHVLLSSELIELNGKRCIVTVGTDMTDQLKAEADLRASHAFIRQIIDADPNFLFAKDREGRFTLVNKAVADACGSTVEALIGKTDVDFNRNPEEVAAVRAKDLEVMDLCRDLFIPEETIIDASGRVRWLQTVKRPIFDEEGRVTMVLGASTDITERKRIEEALRQRERDLRTALEEREQISQDLHDDILQSLYAVGLGLETCRPYLKKGQKKRVMSSLDQAVGQLNGVMQEVRAFITGLESDLWRDRDLSFAIRTMVHALAQPRETRCRVSIDPLVGQTLTPEQGIHLFGIVKEAMSNSLRHAKAKHTTVSLKRVKEGVRLTISDDGVGFTPARVSGSGHGLVNMASRAAKVGAKFAIFSKPKQGTRVVLDLAKEMSHA
jgi:PAS domain S-box-containing protein